MTSISKLPPELFLHCFTVHQLLETPCLHRQRRYLDRLETYRLAFTSPIISYLTFKEWVEVDKAITNHRLRRDYLTMISGLSILHPLRHELINYPLFIEWAKSRKLQFRGVVVSPHSLLLLRQHAELLLPNVQEIIVTTPSKELFTPMISLLVRISARNRILVFDANDRITVPGLKKVLKASPLLTSLSVRGCRYINTQMLQHIPVFSPNLTALYMSKCRLLADDIISTVRNLPSLLILDLSSCISYQTASTLLEIRPTLQELYINNLLGSFQYSRSDIVTAQLQTFSRSLFHHGRALKALSMQESSLLTNTTLIPWLTSTLSVKRHTLEFLCVSACRNITDDLLAILAEHCPLLQTLDVRDCGQLTDQGVSMIGLLCQYIGDVALDGCFQVTHESIITFYRVKPADRVKISFRQCFRVMQRHIDKTRLIIVE